MRGPSSDQLDGLLERHLSVLGYDSLEPRFADSAAEWTDSPGAISRPADDAPIATARPSEAVDAPLSGAV